MLTEVLLLASLGVSEVAEIGLVSLYLCWVHADRFALHPHVLVQVLAIERIAELQGVPSQPHKKQGFQGTRAL